jgi:hypothetical protein
MHPIYKRGAGPHAICKWEPFTNWSATLVPKYELGKARDLEKKVGWTSEAVRLTIEVTLASSLKADRTFEGGFLLMLPLQHSYFVSIRLYGSSSCRLLRHSPNQIHSFSPLPFATFTIREVTYPLVHAQYLLIQPQRLPVHRASFNILALIVEH